MARGDYLAFLDDDDLWEADYLSKMEHTIRTIAPDAVAGRLDELRAGVRHEYKDPTGALTIERLLVHNPGVTGSNMVLRREAFHAVGGFDPRLVVSEDKSLFIDLLSRGKSVTTQAEAVAVHRQHEQGHLSRDATMASGLLLFIQKYDPILTPPQRRHLLFRVASHRLRAQPTLMNTIHYAVSRLLHGGETCVV